jgi:hypothetical protein
LRFIHLLLLRSEWIFPPTLGVILLPLRLLLLGRFSL